MNNQFSNFRIKIQLNILLYLLLTCIMFIFIGCGLVTTEGWKTYRHDNQRSGVTPEQVTPPLSLRWKFQPTHAPKPAWMKPSEEIPRMHFDNVYHVSVANGLVYFGSSVDNQVYALELATGEVCWTFYTGGPVRLAPTIWKNRLYVGSDDGYVYCLETKSGELIWKYRPGPSDEKVLGNGRMISLWPVRTSVLVDRGIAYFGAGVFPYEGLYICALNADNGKVIWKNDTVGELAHELQYGGITPQGYLLASENILYVPSGRAMPAAFERKSGRFLYYMSPGSKVGGTWGVVEGDKLIAGVDRSGTPAKVTYDSHTGERRGDAFASFDGLDLALIPDIAYTLTQNGIYAIDRTEFEAVNKKLESAREEQKKCQGLISDLNRKLSQAATENRKEITKQLEEATQKFDRLIAEVDSLKNATCKWQYACENLNSLILTGNIVFAAGNGSVTGLDAQTGKMLWQAKLDGNALGLAAADGNLIVSTDSGPIYCFAEEEAFEAQEVKSEINSSPYPQDELTPIYESATETILKATSLNTGYCLVLDCNTGRLAFELAKRTELKIIGINEDLNEIKLARKHLNSAGLYGSRVVVEPWKLSTLPDYFANLIVSDAMIISGELEGSSEEMFRVLKPCGGIAFLGQPDVALDTSKALEPGNLLNWLKIAGAPEPESVPENGVWAKLERKELAGAGSWTHQYCNPQNTCCSDEQLVKCPLGVLWYGEPGPGRMVERHAKAAAPVALNGRLFIQGENVIMAYDSYNGTCLWKKEIPGAVRVRADVDGGNLALTDDGLFVATGDKCVRLDPTTGEMLHTYTLPGALDNKPHRWGYMACVGKSLFGSAAIPLKQQYDAIWQNLVRDNQAWKNKEELSPEFAMAYKYYIESKYPLPDENARRAFQRNGTKWHPMTDFPDWSGGIRGQVPATDRLMASDVIFATDIETGNLRWVHRGKKIANIGISIGDGMVFLLESSLSKTQREAALREKQQLVKKGIWEEFETPVEPQAADVRLAVALDATTGEKRWHKPIDLTGCGGDAVATAFHDDVLLFFGSIGLHDKWRFPAGQLRWHRVTALSTKTREILWSRPLNYMVRPLIIDNTVIIEPRACDLHTGEIKMRIHPITGQQVPWEFYRPGHTCAITSATQNGLYYRSYNTAFYDLAKDGGLTYIGAIRPGCWINIVPANGLLLFPEASAGCTCSFPLRSTVVLKSKEQEKTGEWSVFITHGSLTPAKHFAINLGAPGDRRDDTGTVWFGYPRPKADYGVKFNLHEKVLPGMGYFGADVRYANIEASETAWLFTSGCLGLRECKLPLIDDTWGEAPGIYTVRLGFAAPSGDQSGQRVFDIKLQGELVIENFDIVETATVSNKAVIKEFRGIGVKNELMIELVPNKSNPGIAQSPILNFIEVIREDEIKLAQAPEPVKPLTQNQAETILKAAKQAFDQQKHERALALYHRVFDGAPSLAIKRQALAGMTAIGNPTSLSRIAPYCKDSAPILWNYKEPDPELKDGAVKLYLAIANNAAKEDKQQAIKMLNHTFTLTNNLDIRYQIVTSLEKLGFKIDAVAAEEGFITRWHFIGPFPCDEHENPLDKMFVNEPNINLDSTFQVANKVLKWQKYVSEQGMIDLVKLISSDTYVSVYAYSKFVLNKERDLLLKIGSDDGFKCWFNGQEVGRYNSTRGWEPDQDVLMVKGKKGVNNVLLKISQLGGEWAFSVRLTDLDNQPLLGKATNFAANRP